jgi:hypothetical protein
MQGIDGFGSFEAEVARICAELKAICEMAEELVGRVAQMDSLRVPPDVVAIAAIDEACHAMIARQDVAHRMLATQVADIATSVDQARAVLDAGDVPRRSDLWLGRISKALMRRRMAARSGRSGQGERLSQVLGRCDRLAGVIDTYRSDAKRQRDRAEDAFSRLHQRDGENDTKADLQRSKDVEDAQALEQAAISLSAVVDALNGAIGDHTVLLNKLTFDVEHALEVYNVLADMGLVRDALPGADAYPHFSPSIKRLAEGILPGGRLAQARQSADRAFVKRFAKA